jgi:protein tyrosine kinase modulator
MTDKLFVDEQSRRSFSFTLRDVVAICFRHKRIMTLSFCGILAGAILAAIFLPSKYQADTKLLVKRERADAVVTAGETAPVMFRDTVSEEELNSEVELIHSEDVLRQVVVTCGLDRKKSLLSFVNFRDSGEDRIAKAVAKLKAELIADPIKKTNVIDITYSNEDPKLAANVLSTLNKAYIQKHVAVERPAGQYEFFERETAQYKKALQEAEDRLREFSAQQGGVAPGLMRDLTIQKVNEFSSTLQTTRSSIIEVGKRIQALEKQAGTTPTRMTTQLRKSDDAQVLQTLKGTLTTLELKRTELLTKYQPTYPLVKEVDKELESTRAALAKEESQPLHEETTDQNPTYTWVDSELAKAKADMSSLQARATATQAIVNIYSANAHELDKNSLLYQDLVRTQKASEENYLLYLKKREEAQIADALDQTRILNVAVAQEPVVPRLRAQSPWMFGLLGFLIAAMVSVGLAFTLDYVDPSFRTPFEVLTELKIPVLAAVPHQQNGKNRVQAYNGNGSNGHGTNGHGNGTNGNGNGSHGMNGRDKLSDPATTVVPKEAH